MAKTANVGRLSVSMVADTVEYVQKLKDAEKKTKASTNKMVIAFKKFQKGIDKPLKAVNKTMSITTKTMKGLGAISGVMAGTFAYLSVKTKDQIVEQHRLANQLGISVSKMQEMEFVGRMVGKSGEQVADAMKETSERISDAARGTGELVPLLEEMNMSFRDFDNLSPVEQFEKLATTLDNVTSNDALYWSDKLGDQFHELYMRVRYTEGGVAGLRKEFEALGGANLSAANKDVVKLETAIMKVDHLWESFKANFIAVIANPMKEAIDNIIKGLKELGGGNINKGMLIALKSFTESFFTAMDAILKVFEFATNKLIDIYNKLSGDDIGVDYKKEMKLQSEIDDKNDEIAANEKRIGEIRWQWSSTEKEQEEHLQLVKRNRTLESEKDTLEGQRGKSNVSFGTDSFRAAGDASIASIDKAIEGTGTPKEEKTQKQIDDEKAAKKNAADNAAKALEIKHQEQMSKIKYRATTDNMAKMELDFIAQQESLASHYKSIEATEAQTKEAMDSLKATQDAERLQKEQEERNKELEIIKSHEEQMYQFRVDAAATEKERQQLLFADEQQALIDHYDKMGATAIQKEEALAALKERQKTQSAELEESLNTTIFTENQQFVADSFGLSKEAALADIIVSGAKAQAKAWEWGYPAALLPSAKAALATAAQTASVMGVNLGVLHSGSSSVPTEGSYLLDEGERVVQPEANKDLTNFLSNDSQPQQTTVNAPVNIQGNVTDQTWFVNELTKHREIITAAVTRTQKEYPRRR